MRSNIKRAALSLALSFLAGCIVNIPEQEGKRPANADMPADLAKDSSQDLDPDMVKPGKPVRIEAPPSFSVSLGSPRELVANVVDEQGIPIPELEVTYTKTTSGIFDVYGKRIAGTEVGEGKLELSAQGVPSVTVDIQVIKTELLELPPTIYLDVTEELPLMDLSRGITAQDERDLLQFKVENDQIAGIDSGSIRGLMRGETKLTATLLHLSQEIRVVVRKPVDQLLISPPMLRLLSNEAQGNNFKDASFEVVSLDEDGLVRELAPDETLCEMGTFKMNGDRSWSITAAPDVSPMGVNQHKLAFTSNVVGFGSLELECLVEGTSQNASALVEVVFDKQVAAGGAHSCATKDTNNGALLLQCWGSNELSALGLKLDKDRGGLANAKIDGVLNEQVWRLDAGPNSTCAVSLGPNDTGQVFCAGERLMREGDDFYKVELPQGVIATDVSVGVAHACAVSQDGALYCWGDNSFGQLGQGDKTPKLLPPKRDGEVFPEPVQVDATRKWVRVSAGAQHTCALDVYGQAFCWGNNGFGRLGDGAEASRLSPVAVASPNEQLRFVSIAAADTHTCAVERSGSVYCWGQNHQGRLGQAPGPLSFSSPQLVSGGALMERLAVDIDSSAGSTCALVRRPTEKIRPVCWGENSKGQLGRPASTAQITPELFQSPPSKHTLDLAMGAEHGCLSLLGEDAPFCWGARQNKRLGDDENGFNELFQSVNLPQGIVDASFQSNHGCVALNQIKGDPSDLLNSNVICWGLNSYKQANNLASFTVGNPDNTPSLKLSTSNAPGQRPKEQKLTKIFTGPTHSCGLDADGFAFCWGGNWAGQANPKTTETQLIMAGVSPSARFSQLALGQGFTCGIIQGGADNAKIACWGDVAQGRLGNAMGSTCPDATTSCVVKYDLPVNENPDFTHIATAFTTTCAIGKNDTTLGIYCWGAKVTKDATKVEQANSAVKVWVAPDAEFKAFALVAGDAHFCALVGDGASPSQLLCWGDNSFGEVTGGPEPWVHEPTAVPGINASDISSMALGSDHTCILSVAGELSCWGRNNVNQLNNELNDMGQPFSRKPNERYYAPRFFNGTRSNVEKLLGGESSTCVQAEDRIYCAGDNAYRQLGGNPPGDIAPTPELVKNF